LTSGRTLSCRAVGTSYKRVVAFCSASGVDLSCAQVRAGHASKRYSEKDRVCR
jgi:endonuclease YncB( thermonuclease family)